MSRIIIFFISILYISCDSNHASNICNLNEMDSQLLSSFPQKIKEKNLTALYDSSKLILYSLQYDKKCEVYNFLQESKQDSSLSFLNLLFDTLVVHGDTVEFSYRFVNRNGFFCTQSSSQFLYFSIAWEIKTNRLLALIPLTSQIIWVDPPKGILIKKEPLSEFVSRNASNVNPWLIAKLKQLNWLCR